MRRVARLAAAVSLVRSQVFDFVLCDLNLPDARGTDTVRALSPIVGESPLIVMTGMDDDELAAQAVKAGAQDYLVKGHVDATILRRTLRSSAGGYTANHTRCLPDVWADQGSRTWRA